MNMDCSGLSYVKRRKQMVLLNEDCKINILNSEWTHLCTVHLCVCFSLDISRMHVEFSARKKRQTEHKHNSNIKVFFALKSKNRNSDLNVNIQNIERCHVPLLKRRCAFNWGLSPLCLFLCNYVNMQSLSGLFINRGACIIVSFICKLHGHLPYISDLFWWAFLPSLLF